MNEHSTCANFVRTDVNCLTPLIAMAITNFDNMAMYFGFENYNNKGVQNAFILSRMGDPDLHGDHDAYRLKRTGDLDLQFLIRRSRCLIQLKTNWKS